MFRGLTILGTSRRGGCDAHTQKSRVIGLTGRESQREPKLLSLSEFPCDRIGCTTFFYSYLNRSPNSIANCVLAAVHSLCGIFQF